MAMETKNVWQLHSNYTFIITSDGIFMVYVRVEGNPKTNGVTAQVKSESVQLLEN